ncbi:MULTISPECIES: nuclear transport factor 2 family protein [Olivibacter]
MGAAVTGYTGAGREIAAVQRHAGPNGMPLASNSFNLQHLLIMRYELSRIMEENLDQVWNEKDPAARLKAIEKIYSESAILHHVEDQVTGFDAINESVSTTQKVLPSNFVFTKQSPVIINNGIGRLVWGVGPAGQQPVATGMDIVQFHDGKIVALFNSMIARSRHFTCCWTAVRNKIALDSHRRQ